MTNVADDRRKDGKCLAGALCLTSCPRRFLYVVTDIACIAPSGEELNLCQATAGEETKLPLTTGMVAVVPHDRPRRSPPVSREASERSRPGTGGDGLSPKIRGGDGAGDGRPRTGSRPSSVGSYSEILKDSRPTSTGTVRSRSEGSISRADTVRRCLPTPAHLKALQALQSFQPGTDSTL